MSNLRNVHLMYLFSIPVDPHSYHVIGGDITKRNIKIKKMINWKFESHREQTLFLIITICYQHFDNNWSTFRIHWLWWLHQDGVSLYT